MAIHFITVSAPIKARILKLTKGHKNRAVAAILAVLLTLSAVGCSFVGPKETTGSVEGTDLPSSITTAQTENTTEISTTEIENVDVPDTDADPFTVLSNAGNLEIRTTLLPLRSAGMDYCRFTYDDRYFIYVTRKRDQYADLYIFDSHNGEFVYSCALDVSADAFYITFTDEGCIVYGKHENAVTCAYAVTDTDGVFSVMPTTVAAYPTAGTRFVSPDGQYIAYETRDDADWHSGIDIRHPDGRTERIFENIMLNNEFAGGIAGFDDMTEYKLIGFADATHLLYWICSWGYTKGYGIYDVATGEKEEVPKKGYLPEAVYNGVMYGTVRSDNLEVCSYETLWKKTQDGEYTVLASHDAADGVPLVSENSFCEFKGGIWIYHELVTSGEYASQQEDGQYNAVILRSSDFDTVLAEIDTQELERFYSDITVYGNLVTFVVPAVSADAEPIRYSVPSDKEIKGEWYYNCSYESGYSLEFAPAKQQMQWNYFYYESEYVNRYTGSYSVDENGVFTADLHDSGMLHTDPDITITFAVETCDTGIALTYLSVSVEKYQHLVGQRIEYIREKRRPTVYVTEEGTMITSLADWESINYDGAFPMDGNCYAFINSFVHFGGKADLAEQYPQIAALQIDHYTVFRAVGGDRLYFNFTVTKSELETLPRGYYETTVREGVVVFFEILSCDGQERVTEIETDRASAKIVKTWIGCERAWDLCDYGTYSDRLPTQYLLERYYGNDMPIEELIPIIRDKCGVEVTPEQIVEMGIPVTTIDGKECVILCGIGGFMAYDIVELVTDGEVDTVTVQYYNDVNKLIPSIKVEYRIDSEERPLDCTLVEDSVYEPLGMQAGYKYKGWEPMQ